MGKLAGSSGRQFPEKRGHVCIWSWPRVAPGKRGNRSAGTEEAEEGGAQRGAGSHGAILPPGVLRACVSGRGALRPASQALPRPSLCLTQSRLRQRPWDTGRSRTKMQAAAPSRPSQGIIKRSDPRPWVHDVSGPDPAGSSQGSRCLE